MSQDRLFGYKPRYRYNVAKYNKAVAMLPERNYRAGGANRAVETDPNAPPQTVVQARRPRTKRTQAPKPRKHVCDSPQCAVSHMMEGK